MAAVPVLRNAAASRHAAAARRCSAAATLAHRTRHTTVAAMNGATNGNGVHHPKDLNTGPLNVLGGPLQSCCTSPMTGYYRDGFCRTDANDFGRHVVCAQVTEEFLTYSRARGNDLVTPQLAYGFPGLKPGDRWCLCAGRWREALLAGKAPPVLLRSTHAKALEVVDLEQLRMHAADLHQQPPAEHN